MGNYTDDFIDRYEKNFGKKLEFDPIQRKPLALPVATALPTSSKGGMAVSGGEPEEDFLLQFAKLAKAAKPPEEPKGKTGGMGTLFKAGMAEVGGMVAGATEYAAGQAESALPFGVAKEVSGDVRNAAKEVRTGFQQTANELDAELSPEYAERIQRSVATLDPNQTVFQGGIAETAKTIGANLVRQAPASLTSLFGYAVLQRMGMPILARVQMTASEGIMSIGEISNTISDEIDSMSEEELMTAPAYAKLIESGLDLADARQQFIAEAQGAVPALAGLTVGVISNAAGRYLEPLFKKGGGDTVINRFGKGYMGEMLPESAQGGAEQIAKNISAQIYDQNRGAMDNVGSSMVEEGFYGGIMGGGISAALGRGAPPPTAIPTQEGTAAAAPPPTSRPDSFGDVFGTNGESPWTPAEDFDPNTFQDTAKPISGFEDSFGTPTPPPSDELRFDDTSREDLVEGGQIDMQLYAPGEVDAMSRAGAAGMRPPEQMGMDLVGGGPNQRGIEPVKGQISLPLTQRQPGIGRQLIPVPDEPTAEPAADLYAQVEELMEPTSERKGVYLSPDNMAMEDGGWLADTFTQNPEGVEVIDNVDGKGGVLIAKNADVANDIREMIRTGTPMQQVLGYATGSGAGKPADGDTAIQRVDEDGNVLQETLVNEAEAPTIMQQWQARYPLDNVVMLTPDEVIERRNALISEETKARTGDLFAGEVDTSRKNFEGEQGVIKGYTPNVSRKDRPTTKYTGKQEVTSRTVEKVVPRRVSSKYELYEAGNKENREVFPSYDEAVTRAEAWEEAGIKTVVAPIRWSARIEATETTEERDDPNDSERIAGTSDSRKKKRLVYEKKYNNRTTPITGETQDRPGTIRLKKPTARPITGLRSGYRAEERKYARTVADTVKERAKEKKKSVGGFYHPSSLVFEKYDMERQYEKAFDELEAGLIAKTMLGGTESKETDDKIAEARKKLSQIRSVGKPQLVSEQAVKDVPVEAKKSLTGETNRKRIGVEKKETEASYSYTGDTGTLDDLADMSEEQIDELADEELTEVFHRVAIYQSGREASAFTYGAPSGGDTNDIAPGADDALPEVLSGAELIPAGAEPMALTDRAGVKTEGSAKFKVKEVVADQESYEKYVDADVRAKYKDVAAAGKNGFWKYTIVSDKGDSLSFSMRGSKSAAVKAAAARVADRNKEFKAPYEQASGLLYDDIVKSYGKTPSEMKKLISRVLLKVRKTKKGLKSEPASRKKKKNKDGDDISGYFGPASDTSNDMSKAFDPQYLFVDRTPRDESVADRKKRIDEGFDARDKLKIAIATMEDRLTEVMDDPLANETEPSTGDYTKGALRFRIGQMYVQQIMQLGQAFIDSDIVHGDQNWQMNKISKFLAKVTKMSPEAFANEMNDVAKANEQQFIEAKKTGTDKKMVKVKEALQDPKKRAKWLADWNREMAANTAALMRRTQIWRRNEQYKSAVEPFLMKVSDAVVKVGYNNYVPTRAELQAVQWALQSWNNNLPLLLDYQNEGTYSELLYKPLKRYFSTLGYEFDDKGELIVPEKVGLTDTQLATAESKRKDREKKSYVAEVGFASRGKAASTLAKEFLAEEQIAKQVEAENDRYKDLAASIRQTGEWFRVNRIIAEFKEAISDPKITVAGLIRREQRFVRNMKEMGIWADTPSPIIGKITHPATGVTKNISLAGPRLASKVISKERGRSLMQNVTEFRLPMVPKDVREATRTNPQRNPGDLSNSAGPASGGFWGQRFNRLENEINRKLESETDDFLELIDTKKNKDNFEEAAVGLYNGIGNNPAGVSGHELLDSVIANTPAGHPYHEVAARMRNLASTNIHVRWSNLGGDSVTLKETNLGVMRHRKEGNYVLVNFMANMKLASYAGSDVANASLIHTVLHELTHAATAYQLRNDPAVARAFQSLKDQAARDFRARGVELPYGLKADKKINEFVAEAFTNTAFQAELAGIRADTKQNLWQKFVSFVKNILGMPDTGPSLLDVVMASSGRVFSDRALMSNKTDLDLESADPQLSVYVGGAVNRVMEVNALRRAVKAGKWAGVRAPLSLMTVNQIRDEFKDTVKGLDEYTRAFKRRDARNAELMERATKLSQAWTKLTEDSGAAMATEFSWIATGATVNGVHPDLEITHEKNKHIKEPGQIKAHKELRAAFKKLAAGWAQHYTAVQKYYAETLERESILLTQNSLRAVLTKGKDAMMLVEDFEREFTYEVVSGLNTKKALEDKMGDVLDADMIATITAMRTLPVKRTGPYFPIMRYGDYIITASRQKEVKKFNDVKEARAWRSTQMAEDPTLEITLRESDNGGTEATVVEKEFMLAESATEAQIKRDELVQEYGEDNVSAVKKKLDMDVSANIQSNAALGTILNQLEGNAAAQAAVRQYYLRSIADSSFRKHEIKRKNRRGYDSKIQHRNFASYAQSSSYYTAQLEFGWKMAAAMKEMRENIDTVKGAGREAVRMSEVYEIIADRDAKTADPNEIAKFTRKAAGFTQFMMLTSPAYWMLNATQPYMVSMPFMAAKHGYGQTVAAMGHAQKLIASPLVKQVFSTKGGLAAFWSKTQTEEAFNVLDEVKTSIMENMKKSGEQAKGEDILEMLDELRRESILDLSWVAEMREISQGIEGGLGQRTLDASRIMSHLTEVNNRIMTAIAAYNLAVNTGSKEQAIEYAKKVVASTHFDYSSGNKPMLFRPDGPLGAAAPLVFQFMQWPQHMYAMFISNAVKIFKSQGVERKEAAKILLGMMGTHVAAAGVIGWMLQPAKWAIGAVMMLLGDEDDEITLSSVINGETADRAIQRGIASVAGPTVAEAMAKGLPAAMGVDLSSRLSMGTLLHLDVQPDTMESMVGSSVMSVGGAWLSLGANGVRATQELANGNIAKAVEYMSPKILKDFFKTYRYAKEGIVNNRGDTLLQADEFGPLELFTQSIGIAPTEVGRAYDRQAAVKDVEMSARDRKEALIKQYMNAETPEERAETIKETIEFSRKFPSERITRSALLSAYQSRRDRNASYRRYGANLQEKQRRFAQYGDYIPD